MPTVQPLLAESPPPCPTDPGQRLRWTGLRGATAALALARLADSAPGPLLVIARDSAQAAQLERELRFFSGDTLEMLEFPDWEILPYDRFSPHQDLISARLRTMSRLPHLSRGLLVVPVATLMQRLPPTQYVNAHGLSLRLGEPLALPQMQRQLEAAGYVHVGQVVEHGEFAVRGGLLDLFPMGSQQPYRIELFDDEVESIRAFDPDSQRSQAPQDAVEILPGREFPVDGSALERFYANYLTQCRQNPARSPVYQALQNGRVPAGVEFYLPLFFEQTATLFDYLPQPVTLAWHENAHAAAETFWAEVCERHEERSGDLEHPPLSPDTLYLSADALFGRIKDHAQVSFDAGEAPRRGQTVSFATAPLPDLEVQARAHDPLARLRAFIEQGHGRTLLCAESAGRREMLLETLQRHHLSPHKVDDWSAFLRGQDPLALTVAPLAGGALLPADGVALVTETELYGARSVQERRIERATTDVGTVIRSLSELDEGDAVVHVDYGVGRYTGLQTLEIGGQVGEYLTLAYAGGDRIHVPIANLSLVHRYSGQDAEHAPLHRLGTPQWERARKKAREQVRDAAAELLAIYAQRAARQGRALPAPEPEYADFAAGFAFDETPDQLRAIHEVLSDLARPQPMDRVICGDVGFGKTEVAMRAAFVAAMNGQQVAVLVPTTLLTQQHAENFRDRFAAWPLRVEGLSRFRSKNEQSQLLADLAAGRIDIIIGTHRLLQRDVEMPRLGLVIIDEEHRFGVRQKERFKALRAEVDMLTLTATPIPRTLGMAMAGIRDLSVIATPPAKRLAVRSFVSSWDPHKVREACLREFKRGGQVYFLHNKVETIERVARDVASAVPEADLRVAHGQLSERELERIMLDFSHQRFNLLVCTTIVESGIDVPTANTLIVDRADRLGLAQLHQLRGRVGRSHHQAYAYFMVPHRDLLKGEALKRLEAIEKLGDLGIGFTLATHDMEIRGAGELLGDEQSGHIQEIGFTLYTDLLESAVTDLQSGREPDFADVIEPPIEVNLGAPALIPADYVHDVHTRLALYKRISSAPDDQRLDDLESELIDRFGLLPAPVKTLMLAARLRNHCHTLGIIKLKAPTGSGHIEFGESPAIEVGALIDLMQSKPALYRFDGRTRLQLGELPEALAARTDQIIALFDAIRTPAQQRQNHATAG